jgi:hypothetical protein
MKFIVFLRLFMVNYYTGVDNCKILCTMPSSLEFEVAVLSYLKDIIGCVYGWYP